MSCRAFHAYPLLEKTCFCYTVTLSHTEPPKCLPFIIALLGILSFFNHFFQDSWTELFIRLRLSRDLVPANIVLGAQWGDEGKGKAIDQLAPNSTWAVRFQGGNNAGHTIVLGDTTLKLHQIPSGVTSMAVSYTHLRAHETRHDLVCRLLLEKND